MCSDTRVNEGKCAQFSRIAYRLLISEQDYQTLIAQLEHAHNNPPTFTLQQLWFYVHPTLHTLSLLYQLTTELATADEAPSESSSESTSDAEEAARNEALGLGGAKLKAVLSEINSNQLGVSASTIIVKGGEVLTIIHERMHSMAGDPAAKELYSALLKAAGAPYVEMVLAWIRTGKLVDPYEEMCVKESKFIDRGTLEMDYTDEYWERRYTVGCFFVITRPCTDIATQLRDGSTIGGSSKRQQAGIPLARTPGGRLPGGACVPPALERWKHKMLLAGKYLNVIRECGITISNDTNAPEDNDMSLDDERCVLIIARTTVIAHFSQPVQGDRRGVHVCEPYTPTPTPSRPTAHSASSTLR